MWILGGCKGAERVFVACTASCPHEAARRAYWVPPDNFVASSGRRRRRRRWVVAAAGRGTGAALARFPAVAPAPGRGWHKCESFAGFAGTDRLHDSRCRPLCTHGTTGWRRRVVAAAHRRPFAVGLELKAAEEDFLEDPSLKNWCSVAISH